MVANEEGERVSRLLSNDDTVNNMTETNQMTNTLYMNVLLFCGLVVCFEIVRHMKSIYANRLTKRFQKSNRVPPKPSPYPLFWIKSILKIPEDEVLRMVGLDGYMLLRYIAICMRLGAFLSFWGIVVLVPIYYNKGRDLAGWNRYTLANIPNSINSDKLWAPVLFAYLFSIFFCQMMYYEYKNFIIKRVEYLVQGDDETPMQTYYTVMIERIPTSIKSAPMLSDFFERLFPGDIYSVEVALDLNDLEALCRKRKLTRNSLEKSIALYYATETRPLVWVKSNFYDNTVECPTPVLTSSMANFLGYKVYDAIEHYYNVLHTLNDMVSELQKTYFEQRQELDEIEGLRLLELKKNFENKTFDVFNSMKSRINDQMALGYSMFSTPIKEFAEKFDSSRSDSNRLPNITEPTPQDSESIVKDVSNTPPPFSSPFQDNPTQAVTPTIARSQKKDIRLSSQTKSTGKKKRLIPRFKKNGQEGSERLDSESSSSSAKENLTMMEFGEKFRNVAMSGVDKLAKEGFKTAEFATKGALRGVLEATRALELLTVGAYYKVSSTAFVTFRSRVSKCASHQMLLSHDHYGIEVKPAPNPNDIIWENVSIPQSQIQMRKSISDGTLIVGAIFWSIVVTFITAVSNLESISQEVPALQDYSNTTVYKFLNNYLAIGILLILISILPFIFDFICRNYEGIKLESEIQNSIMTRYFYYQLANVFVSVGLGSIANSLHQIINDPSSILRILGDSLPSFSIYFTNFLIIKTFTAVPIEMLRIFPLLDILRVRLCSDKKKCTRRELKTGAFADPPMLYGWVYPNLLMVLMIMLIYSCIAPFLMPFCALFYCFAYLMYKYQLLYVYINDYQSGGFMWYAVFDRSMVALIGGVLTLLCYLGIRKTFISGPFYVLFPLPFLISLFWSHCNSRIKGPALNLSLERAMEIDKSVRMHKEKGYPIPQDVFNPTLFRQPSLVEGRLKPSPYRKGFKRRDSLLKSRSTYPENDHSEKVDLEKGSFNGTKANKPSTGGPTNEQSPLYHSSLYFIEEEEIEDAGNEDDFEIEQEVNAILEDNGVQKVVSSESGQVSSSPVVSPIYQETDGALGDLAQADLENTPILEEKEDGRSYGSTQS